MQAIHSTDNLDFLRDRLRVCLQMKTPGEYAGNPIRLDRIESRGARAIWTLQTSHIQNMLARYAPSQARRANSARHLAQHAAKGLPNRTVRERTRIIALTLILNPWAARRLNEVFDMTREEWRVSDHRILVRTLRSYLHDVDVESLQAWERAVENVKYLA